MKNLLQVRDLRVLLRQPLSELVEQFLVMLVCQHEYVGEVALVLLHQIDFVLQSQVLPAELADHLVQIVDLGIQLLDVLDRELELLLLLHQFLNGLVRLAVLYVQLRVVLAVRLQLFSLE